jgi:hypothetical protein
MKLCEIKDIEADPVIFTTPWPAFKSFIQSDSDYNAMFKKFCVDEKLKSEEYRELLALTVSPQCLTGVLSKHMIIRGINGNQWKNCVLMKADCIVDANHKDDRAICPVDDSFILKVNKNFYSFTSEDVDDWEIKKIYSNEVADTVNMEFFNLNTYALGARFRERGELDKQHSFAGNKLHGYLLYI